MTIKVGDKLPSVTLTEATAEGPKPVKTDDLFRGKRVPVRITLVATDALDAFFRDRVYKDGRQQIGGGTGFRQRYDGEGHEARMRSKADAKAFAIFVRYLGFVVGENGRDRQNGETNLSALNALESANR